MGSDFGIFEGLDSSVLVDEPGFGSDLISVFLDLGLGSAHFWQNQFEVWAFWRGFEWVQSLVLVGKHEFEFRPVKFEAVQSSIYYFSSIQH